MVLYIFNKVTGKGYSTDRPMVKALTTKWEILKKKSFWAQELIQS